MESVRRRPASKLAWQKRQQAAALQSFADSPGRLDQMLLNLARKVNGASIPAMGRSSLFAAFAALREAFFSPCIISWPFD